MKDLKVRVITAIILILILAPAVYFGGYFMLAICGLTVILSGYELEHMYKKDNKWSLSAILNIILGFISYLSLYISLYTYKYIYVLFLLIFVFIFIVLTGVLKKNGNIDSIGKSIITIFYPSIGFASLVYLRNMPTSFSKGGLVYIIYLILCVSMTDTFAYFFGSKFGKHKLAINISPNKTVEGAIYGSIFGVLLATVYAFFIGISKDLFSFTNNTFLIILLTIILSTIISIVDQFGDLFESRLKRSYGLKDFSNLLPGHGGILDRFDSYIATSPLLLIIVTLL